MPEKLSSIRSKLVTIVLACLLPSLIGLGLLIFHFYETERAQLEQDALQTVRALTAAVDRDLEIGENAALALATARSIETGDLASFHARAKSLLRDEFPGFTFVLSDESGQQVLNTLRPYGEPLPRHGNPDQLRRVFATGKPVISDLYMGGVTKRPLVGVDVPVWRDGKVAYDLSVAFLPERLGRILTGQHLPPGRIVAIFDSKGVIVARTHMPENFVGQKGTPELLRAMGTDADGIVETDTLEGIRVLLAYSRSSATGWAVALGIPKATVVDELFQSVFLISLAVLVLLAAGFGAALVLGGRIGRAVQALTAPILALGAGKPVAVPPPYFREAVQVTAAVKTVEGELYGYRHRLEALVSERTEALHASTARLGQILEAAGEGIYGVGNDNRVTFANRATARILGWTDPESRLGIPGEQAIGHVLADGRPCSEGTCPIHQTLADGITRRVQDEFFLTAGGHAVPVEYVVAPHRLDGGIAGAVVVFSDITERLRDSRRLADAYGELEEQGRRLAANRDFVSAILDSVASHIAILDADGTIAEENGPWRKFARDNGLPAGWSGVGSNYLTVCRKAEGEDRSLALAAAEGIEDVIAGRRAEFMLEYPCDAPGRKRWFQLRVTPLKGRQGRVVVSHDSLSELKFAEAALRESEDRLALATRGAHIGIWDWDIATNDLLWSDETFEQLGVLKTETPPTFPSFRSLLHPEDRERFDQEIVAALRGDRAFDTEVKVIRPDGDIRHLNYAGQVFRDGAGRPVRMVGISYDISERKQIERRLAEMLDFNQKIITECPVGITVYKSSGDCVLANESYARIMGGTVDDILSSNFRAMPGWTEAGLLAAAEEALETGEMRQVSAHHMTPFGREVWAEVFFAAFTSGGEPHLLCIKSDMTELTRSNQELAVARDTAEAASRAKSEFVANMSHEIRTPMNAIMGLSRLLEDSAIGIRERDYVTKIKLSAQSLLGILNDILDFSKIEAGRMEIEHAPFSLDEVLRNLSAVVSTNARDKGIEAVFSVEADVPLALVGDSLRLQQVLLNLTGNAVKFTNRGEVVLAIRKIAEGEAGVTLEFSVRDTGIGIPLEKQQGLFAAFSQADSSTSRRYGGTGLGLAISTRLAALMGGSITFTSQYRKGSDFRFTARFGLAHLCAPARPSLAGMEKLSVLVVDDNDTARTVLVHTCRSFRWHVEEAASAAAGIDLLRRYTAQGRDVDILLLDWRMPEIDGVEMLRLARADPTVRLPRVILMVTAFGGEAIADDADQLPIDAVLAKPATPSAIFDAVATVRGAKSPADGIPLSPPLAGRLAGARILLVEDNDINQEVARDILVRAGATVEIAGDGLTALELLDAGADRFDAVLMDVQMPGMDGYAATEIIRSRLDRATLPIIAMTANAMESDRRKSAEAGMNAHLAKPIDVDELIATLIAHVPGIGRNAAPPFFAADGGPPSDQPELPAHLPGIDIEPVLARLGGDRRIFLSLMARLEASQGGVVTDVRLFLAEGNGVEAANLLHRLRGVAANLGATEVARLAGEAEAAVRGGGRNEAAGPLDRLEAALAVVLETARTLASVAAASAGGPALDAGRLGDRLTRLLILLRSNDLKASDELLALRTSLETLAGRAVVTALADAIDGLDFSAAEAYVLNIMKMLNSQGGG